MPLMRCNEIFFQSFSGEAISGGAGEFLPPGYYYGQTLWRPVSQQVNGDAERDMQ